MTTRRFRSVVVVTALGIAALWAPVYTQSPKGGLVTKVSAGKGTLYVGIFPDHFVMIDEATLRITGKIPYTSGIPRRTSLSRDRTRFYTTEAQMEKVEIIDIASKKAIDTFTLSEPNKHVRIKSLDPDPTHQYLMMVTRTATKMIDRWDVGPSVLSQYDLKTHTVLRTIPWPNGEERENANIQFSPDGKLMYLFSDSDILIFDTTDFKQVDKWELSKPLEEGFARLDFGQVDAVNDEPGFYSGIFTTQDPVNHRRIMGIGRVNLAAKSIEFYTLGPATAVGFTMAPGRKKAYGLMSEIGRFEFWQFDLENKRIGRRTEFQGRPRMSLKTSSNGQVLYIYNAGNTIDLYDAATFTYMNTITLDGDMTTDMFVFPPGVGDPGEDSDLMMESLIDPDLRRAIRLVTPYWRRLSLVLGLSLLSTGVSLYLPLLSRDFVDKALIGRDTASLTTVVIRFGIITIVSFGLNIVSGLRYTRVSAEILFDMRLAMYRHLQQLSPRFYAATRLGDIMSRINNDIGEIQRIAAETALAWVGNVLFLVGTIGILAWLDWRLFLLTTVTAPFGLWALMHYRRRLEEHVGVVRQCSSDIGSFLIETVQGVRLVVSSNAQEREVERFRARNNAFIKALMSMQMLTYLSGGLPGLILSSGTGIVFLYGGLQVINGTLSMGTFVAFMAYQARFLSPLQALMGLYTNFATARVSFRRVSEILNVPVEVREKHDALRVDTVRGCLELDNVTLSFGRGRPAIDGISFRVNAGESLAIVGPSGSGKSTIADLLLRQLDPDAGVVRLDGYDLRDFRLADVRRHIAVVEQEPCLLHASIIENIRYARPEATDEEVQRAVRQAALGPFIESLPQQFETVVGERGTALSAGERQRLAIARAFLRDPAVLILDEPTAALDPVSQQQVIAGYEAVMRGRTTIVITHSLELASRADHVLVLDRAQVTERGTPGDLRLMNGHFAALFQVEHAVAAP